MHTVLATVWFIENRLLSRRNYRHLTMIIWFKYNFIQHRTENLTEKYVLNNAKKLHLKHCPVTVEYCNYSEVHQHRPTVDWENLAPCSAATQYLLTSPHLTSSRLTLSHLTSPHLTSSHLSLNHRGCWGTTDDFTTSLLHFSLFSTALWDLANSRPVHSLLLFSHLFLCLPCLLQDTVISFTVLAKRSWLDLMNGRHDSIQVSEVTKSIRECSSPESTLWADSYWVTLPPSCYRSGT